jgi:hypothetical protein
MENAIRRNWQLLNEILFIWKSLGLIQINVSNKFKN